MCAMGFKLQLDYLSLALLVFFLSSSLPIASLWFYGSLCKQRTRNIYAKCKSAHINNNNKNVQFRHSTHTHYYSRMCIVHTQINITMAFAMDKRTKTAKKWEKIERIKDNIQFGAVLLRNGVVFLDCYFFCSPIFIHGLPIPVSHLFVWSIVIWHLHNIALR